MHTALDQWVRMSFPARLTLLRKQHHMTQQALADALGMHLSQIKRYENATSQPTLEALKKITLAFNITADELIFDATERSPPENLRLHFEAVSQLAPEDQQTVLNVIEGLMVKHQAQTWNQRRQLGAVAVPTSAPEAAATKTPKAVRQRSAAR